MRLIFFLFAALLMSANALAAGASETVATPESRTGVAVTVYNQDLALVRDTRRVRLGKGESRIVFSAVSARMQPETAIFSAKGNKSAVRVLEQAFESKLISPQTLLKASVGQDIGLVRINPATGEEQVLRGRLLSVANGPVFEVDGKVRTGWSGGYLFDALPPGLRGKPALVASLYSRAAGERALTLAYLTGGLSWQADYVAMLSGGDSRLALEAKATVRNGSGADFTDTTLKLMAGDVRQVRSSGPRLARAAPMAMMAEAKMADGVAGETISGFHLYSVGRPVTLKDGSTKQVSLISAPAVEVRRELVAEGQGRFFHGVVRDETESNATIRLVVSNTEATGLGLALPAGAVRVYRRDSKGGLQFVGADRLKHTAIGKTARLTLGRDFDVPVKRVQTDFQRVASRLHESAQKVTVSNAGAKPVTVRIIEPIPGDWQILEESRPHKKISAGRAEWRVDVPAGGKSELTYRTRVRF